MNFLASKRGYQDDTSLRLKFSDSGKDIESRQPWHPNIRNDEIKSHVLDFTEGFKPIRRRSCSFSSPSVKLGLEPAGTGRGKEFLHQSTLQIIAIENHLQSLTR